MSEKKVTIVPVLKYYVEYTLSNDDKVASVDFDTREEAIASIHSTADYEGYTYESPHTNRKFGRTETAEIKELYKFEVRNNEG